MMAFGICEKGLSRPENQDAILICRKRKSGLFLVADGVGGSVDGAIASRFLKESFAHWWNEYFTFNHHLSFAELFNSIKVFTEELNKELCSTYGAGTCSSTLALLFVHDTVYGYLSSGDSRIYLCDMQGVRLITRDDIWENQPDADMTSAHKGKILSAVGGYDYLEYSCATGKIAQRTSFLLCSDGIYKFVSPDFLDKQLQIVNKSLIFKNNVLKTLCTAAVKGMTNDNYSLVIVKV